MNVNRIGPGIYAASSGNRPLTSPDAGRLMIMIEE